MVREADVHLVRGRTRGYPADGRGHVFAETDLDPGPGTQENSYASIDLAAGKLAAEGSRWKDRHVVITTTAMAIASITPGTEAVSAESQADESLLEGQVRRNCPTQGFVVHFSMPR